MFLGEYVRNKVYFHIDKLKGGIVSKVISELDQFEKSVESHKREIVTEKLTSLLKDITQHVPFYSQYSSREKLSSFPIIDKKTIINNHADFLSKRFSKEHLIPVHTSGSYGTPLTYYRTPYKKKGQLAEVIFFGRKSDYELGVRHGYFRSNPGKSKFKYWIQNETLFISKRLNRAFVETGLEKLRKQKIKGLIGFPSAITFLAKKAIAEGFTSTDFNVVSVITSSENLTGYQRDIIKEAFNCKIQNRYATEELGLLGHQYEKDGLFEFNTCHYIFEVLKLDKDESVDVGEMGRIVVTDLHSNSMPLIRYETGDLGVLGGFFSVQDAWVDSIQKLSGRTMQIIFSTTDEPLYPLYFDSIMDNYDIFHQYQIIQESKNTYTLRLVTNENFSLDSFDKLSFINKFYEWLGKDAIIEITYVEDIEKLPSGKRPYIINKYKQFSV